MLDKDGKLFRSGICADSYPESHHLIERLLAHSNIYSLLQIAYAELRKKIELKAEFELYYALIA